MAVHVRNMLPMSPLDTGALSGTQQNVDSSYIEHNECFLKEYNLVAISNSTHNYSCQKSL
jgi:hypothetical protein